jgi:heat-inducible transcriptional repressor
MTQEYEELLSERARQLLRVLVASYIRDGQPVGSRALSRESGLNLSSATIRNVMADLEDLGFVVSPHTSAGRIPTDRGYRFFVDTLLRSRALDAVGAGELAGLFDSPRDGDSKSLVAHTSQLLSRVTQLAGVVTVPRPQLASISQIEFVTLSDNRILVILVFDDREVQNRIIQLSRSHSAEELRRASQYLNEQLVGRTPNEARAEILRQLQQDREHLNTLMLEAISMAQQVFTQGQSGSTGLEYIVAGETNLMGAAQLTSVEKLKRLFEAFNEKRDFLSLLDQSLRAEGVQIFIGKESGYQVLDDCSIVTAPYGGDEGILGVIGVIGPTRMAYERVIPIVDVTARLLGSALNSRR